MADIIYPYVDVHEGLHEPPASGVFARLRVPDVPLGAVEAEGDDVGDDEDGQGDRHEQVQVKAEMKRSASLVARQDKHQGS